MYPLQPWEGLKYLAVFRKQNITTHSATARWNDRKMKVFANLSFSLIEDTHTRQTNLPNGSAEELMG